MHFRHMSKFGFRVALAVSCDRVSYRIVEGLTDGLSTSGSAFGFSIGSHSITLIVSISDALNLFLMVACFDRSS